MFNIQHWQLAADAGLIISLLYLALRFTRSNSIYTQNKSQELLTALKALVNDAEEAGRLLNERLIKRQQQLEKVLIELEGAESKLEKIESSADQVLSELKHNHNQATETLEKFGKAVKQFSELEVEVSVEGQVPKANPATVAQIPAVVKPDADVKEEIRALSEQIAADSVKADIINEPEIAVSNSSSTNIYGQPITGTTSSLSSAIEKQAFEPVKEQPIAALETVYDAAEKMLRAGYDLKAIVKHTRLPADEVQMLARIISSTSKNENTSEIVRPIEQGSPVFSGDLIKDNREDARLGVLGDLKKTRITV